jgi:ABC-type branched-subunit amino acid transport system substrate-binding protein
LEFIQFYEGLLLGLEKLEQRGYNVTLNVVDVEGTSDEDVERAFVSHNVAQSDLLIALLTRQPFHKAAELARQAELFIVHPVADRPEIVKGNPYVFKCMPSFEAYAKRTVQTIETNNPNSPIFIVHSKGKGEAAAVAALTAEIEQHPNLNYTLIDWAQSSKLTNAIKSSERSVVISMYNQDKSKNRIYASQLLNKLSAFKTRTPYLYSYEDWSTLYGDIDFSQLQNLNYSTFYLDWVRANTTHRDFIDLFSRRYSTEPTNVYAGMGHDIILYFVTGLQQKGTEFFRSPIIATPQGMIYPLSFSHSRADYGFENQYAILYRMSDFHFIPVR